MKYVLLKKLNKEQTNTYLHIFMYIYVKWEEVSYNHVTDVVGKRK